MNIRLFILFFCFSLPLFSMEMPQGTLNQRLGQAVIGKDVAAVRSLLAQGADPNKSIVWAEPVLKFAVLRSQDGDIDIVKALLDAGADPSLTPELLCDLLNVKRSLNLVIYLEIRDMIIQHPKTNLNCLKQFGQQRADITPVMFAVKDEDHDLIKQLFKTRRIDINIRSSEGKTVFDYARTKAMRGWLGGLAAFYFPSAAQAMPATPMRAAPSVASQTKQPMGGQKRKESEPWQAYTTEFKAARKEVPAAEAMQWTHQIDPYKATIDAINRNDIATALYYLNRVSFDINKEDPGYGRILTIAIQSYAVPVVQRLVQTPELQVNYRDMYRLTPLMLASMMSSPEVVSALLMRSDLLINETTAVGLTALDLTRKNPVNGAEIFRLLRLRGAKTGMELRGGQPQPEKKETTSFPAEVYAKLGLSLGATPHQILGIRSDASADQIKAAFKAKTREWHPDKNPDSMAKEVIQLINWAYRQIGPQLASVVRR